MNIEGLKKVSEYLKDKDSLVYLFEGINTGIEIVEEIEGIQKTFFEGDRILSNKFIGKFKDEEIKYIIEQFDNVKEKIDLLLAKRWYDEMYLDSANGHNEILDEIKKFKEEVFSIQQNLIKTPQYLYFLGTTLTRKDKESKQLLDNLKKQSEGVQKQIDEAKKILVSRLNDKYAEYFQNYSDSQGKWSLFWLGFIVLLVMIILLVSQKYLNFNEYPSNITENNVLIVYLLPRVSIGFTLFYILFFAVKNYRSLKHIQSIYAQKSKSINTYIDYISTLPDSKSDIKDTIRMEVAKTIFEIHETGYIKENKDKDGIENLNIAEIIRAAKQNTN